MKLFVSLALVFMCWSNLFAQDREALLDDIAQKTCTCLSERELSPETWQMGIGLCVLQSSSGRMDAIRSVLGYDISSQADMFAFGEEIGMKLVISCPTFQELMLDAVESGDVDMSELQAQQSQLDDDMRNRINRALGNQGNSSASSAPDHFEDTEEAWLAVERPAEEEPYGNSEETPAVDPVYLEEEANFSSTEEAWLAVERPAEEEPYGNGNQDSQNSDPVYLDAETNFEVSEESWVAINRPAEEEYFGEGGINESSSTRAEREIITRPIANTNRTGEPLTMVSGSVRRISSGPISVIRFRTDDRENLDLLLTAAVPGAEKLVRRARVQIAYRETTRYDAASRRDKQVLEIVRVQ